MLELGLSAGYQDTEGLSQQGYQDTHSILDTYRSLGVGFTHSQTKELTDDPTQEGFDLTRGYPVLPHYLALHTPAYLCGVGLYSGQNYEHRRQWVADRIRLLASPISP